MQNYNVILPFFGTELLRHGTSMRTIPSQRQFYHGLIRYHFANKGKFKGRCTAKAF